MRKIILLLVGFLFVGFAFGQNIQKGSIDYTISKNAEVSNTQENATTVEKQRKEGVSVPVTAHYMQKPSNTKADVSYNPTDSQVLEPIVLTPIRN